MLARYPSGPTDNRIVSSTTRSHGIYTVGEVRTGWISVRGVANGQDVNSWQLANDLNYIHDLVHADHKLVAAHMIPALLGGRVTDDNHVPAVNVVNDWLSDNPEKFAKDLVLSHGACIEYSVTCTFNRRPVQPHNKLAETVRQLVPSAIKVVITQLQHAGQGDPTKWTSYTPDPSTTSTFTVPSDRLSYTPV